MAGIADDDVVKDFDFEKLARLNEVTSDFDVGLGWSRLTARMIVLCAAPVYVQSPIGGAAIHGRSAAKGGICLKANQSSGLSQTRLFAS